jgi:hypothetical protein
MRFVCFEGPRTQKSGRQLCRPAFSDQILNTLERDPWVLQVEYLNSGIAFNSSLVALIMA